MLRSRLAAVVLAASFPLAAIPFDHHDGPAVNADPSSDLTDLFTWMSGDGARVQVVLAVYPGAGAGSRFSSTSRYVVHTESTSSFGTPGTRTDLVCTFDGGTPQRVSCWIGGEYLTGDASGSSGLQSASGKLKVFAGLRADPAFFNAAGFQRFAAAMATALPSLTFNAAVCPAISSATGSALATQLRSDAVGGPGVNAFASQNVLALVVSLDKTLVNAGGPVLGVWASTNKAP
jgi:hypothetical protein